MSSAAAGAENPFTRSKKVSSELFALTYGALVTQLLSDFEDASKVNAKLFEFGVSIGSRLVDELLSKSDTKRCTGFKQAISVVASTGFKMYWNQTPKIYQWAEDGNACSLVFTGEMPIEEFVELPDEYPDLAYSNIVCGVVQGALEQVSMRTRVKIVKDRLRGDEATEIRVELLEILKEAAGDDYKEE